MNRKKRNASQSTGKGRRKKWEPDPEGYYYWLIGKGYEAGVALRMVNAKFGDKTESKDKGLGWAWKDK